MTRHQQSEGYSCVECQCAARVFFFFFFNDTATTEIYTLSLHDALPIYARDHQPPDVRCGHTGRHRRQHHCAGNRSEEHTSELQSPCNLVCRLLLEKKKKIHAVARDEDEMRSISHTSGLSVQSCGVRIRA